MSKIIELRNKRNTLWEQTKAFLEEHRDENGLVEASAAEDIPQYPIVYGHGLNIQIAAQISAAGMGIMFTVRDAAAKPRISAVSVGAVQKSAGRVKSILLRREYIPLSHIIEAVSVDHKRMFPVVIEVRGIREFLHDAVACKALRGLDLALRAIILMSRRIRLFLPFLREFRPGHAVCQRLFVIDQKRFLFCFTGGKKKCEKKQDHSRDYNAFFHADSLPFFFAAWQGFRNSFPVFSYIYRQIWAVGFVFLKKRFVTAQKTMTNRTADFMI